MLLDFAQLKSHQNSYKGFVGSLGVEATPIATHHKHVAVISALICLATEDFSEQDISDVVFAGLVHDICLEELSTPLFRRHLNGEDFNSLYTDIYTRDTILKNQQRHSEMAIERLKMLGVPLTEGLIQCVLYHHENCDGTGPRELKAPEIYRPARVIRIADDLVCLMQRKFNPLALDQAIEELRLYNSTGVQRVYDPDILRALVRTIHDNPVNPVYFWEMISQKRTRAR